HIDCDHQYLASNTPQHHHRQPPSTDNFKLHYQLSNKHQCKVTMNPPIRTDSPIYSHRLVRDQHGRMILIRPNAVVPSHVVAAEIHNRATNIARELIVTRYETRYDLSRSTETLDDFQLEREANEAAASGYKARYSPYFGGVPSKRRMRFDAWVETIRVKVFKRPPTTWVETLENLLLIEYLQDCYNQCNSFLNKVNYHYAKWQISQMSREERHELAANIIENDRRYNGKWLEALDTMSGN
ncbi:hypothetical protein FN846DRAFT_998031, partial [Sphaerosporella brunnea]